MTAREHNIATCVAMQKVAMGQFRFWKRHARQALNEGAQWNAWEWLRVSYAEHKYWGARRVMWQEYEQ